MSFVIDGRWCEEDAVGDDESSGGVGDIQAWKHQCHSFLLGIALVVTLLFLRKCGQWHNIIFIVNYQEV